jgi:hypothetical protein
LKWNGKVLELRASDFKWTNWEKESLTFNLDWGISMDEWSNKKEDGNIWRIHSVLLPMNQFM